MTYRERLMKEHPEINPVFIRGGMEGCPSDYFEVDRPVWCKNMEASFDDCERCWAREVPKKEVMWEISVVFTNGQRTTFSTTNCIEDPQAMLNEFRSNTTNMTFTNDTLATLIPIRNVISVTFKKGE